MAKIAWLGEPDAQGEGPRENIWNGITFPRGVEVEVQNEQMIAKAKRNPSFSVDGKAYVPDGGQPHPNFGKRVQPAGPVLEREQDDPEAGPVIPDRTELGEMNVAELRAEADRRGINHAGLSKAEIRERLAKDDPPAESEFA